MLTGLSGEIFAAVSAPFKISQSISQSEKISQSNKLGISDKPVYKPVI
jgi:hypothetical protein